MSSHTEQLKAYNAWIASDRNVRRTKDLIKLMRPKDSPTEEQLEEHIESLKERIKILIARKGVLGVADAMEKHPKNFNMTLCKSAWIASTYSAYSGRTDRKFLKFSENNFVSYTKSLHKKESTKKSTTTKSTKSKEKPEHK